MLVIERKEDGNREAKNAANCGLLKTENLQLITDLDNAFKTLTAKFVKTAQTPQRKAIAAAATV